MLKYLLYLLQLFKSIYTCIFIISNAHLPLHIYYTYYSSILVYLLSTLCLYIYYTYYTLFNICSDQQKLNYTEIKNISHEPPSFLYRSLFLSSFLYRSLSIIFSLSLDLQNSFKYFYAFCCVCVLNITIVCTFVHKIV